MFDKEMIAALEADGEKLRQLTGKDHGPEFLADCEACDGKGYIARTIHVYETGCGISHPDIEETPCQACGGNGWFVCEADGVAVPSTNRFCPTCKKHVPSPCVARQNTVECPHLEGNTK